MYSYYIVYNKADIVNVLVIMLSPNNPDWDPMKTFNILEIKSCVEIQLFSGQVFSATCGNLHYKKKKKKKNFQIFVNVSKMVTSKYYFTM